MQVSSVADICTELEAKVHAGAGNSLLKAQGCQVCGAAQGLYVCSAVLLNSRDGVLDAFQSHDSRSGCIWPLF